MSFCTLPRDLVDDIIDLLGDDTTCLRSCSLVCKAWIPPARRRLFREISLGPNDDCQKIERLLQVMLSSPDVIQFIRCLHLGAVDWGVNWKKSGWLKILNSLPRLLCVLSNVQTISLHHIFWNNSPLEFRHALKSILRLPSFIRLELRRCYFMQPNNLTCLICSCSALRHLHFSNVEIGPDLYRDRFERDPTWMSEHADDTEDDDAHFGQVEQRYRLDVLQLDWCSQSIIVDWLLALQSPLDMTSIHTLRVVVEWTHHAVYTAVGRLIQSTGHSLRELTWAPPIEGDPYFKLNLQHKPNLHSLSLYACVMFPVNFWEQGTVKDTMSFLSHVTPDNHLRNIRIYVDVFDYEPGGMDWSVWEEADSVLTDRYPELEMVHISLFLLDGDEGEFSTAAEELSICLPLLKAHGMLNVYRRSDDE